MTPGTVLYFLSIQKDMGSDSDFRNYQTNAISSIMDADHKYMSLVMPTGSGKTRVGLEYANKKMKDGDSVAYLVKSNAHAEQVLREAEVIDVPAEHIPGSESDRTSEIGIDKREEFLEDYDIGFLVGVYSYNGYFLGSNVPRANILIIDDAHTLRSQELTYSSVEFTRQDWGRKFKKVRSLLKQQNPQLADQIESIENPLHRGGKAVLVPPPVSESDAEAIKEKVNSYKEGTGWHRYFLRQRLDSSSEFVYWPCIITHHSICWRPFIPPFESLGDAPHRKISENEILLMTSTKDSENFLQERLGLSSPVAQVQMSNEPPEMGSRIAIPYPDLSSYSPPSEAQVNIIEKWVNKFGSTLVSTSSDSAFGKLSSELDSNISITRYTGEESIEEFQDLDKPKILVLVNRFSGIDVRPSGCQTSIHLDLPYSTSGHEVIAGYLQKSGSVADASLAVRLSQLLGRLNRKPDDRSVHLLLTEKLPITRGSVFVKSLDPAVLLDLLIGQRGIKRNHGLPIQDELLENIEVFLDGDDELREQHLERQKRVRTRLLDSEIDDFDPDTGSLIKANLLSSRGNYSESAKRFETLARNAESEGYTAHSSIYHFQAICNSLAEESAAEEILGRTIESAIDKALNQNPPSSPLVNALRQMRSNLSEEEIDSDEEIANIRLRKQAATHFRYWSEEHHESIPDESVRNTTEPWRDYWRNRLTTADHEQLLKAYLDAFELLGTDTPQRGIEDNDAKVNWNISSDEVFTLAVEIKGWDKERGTPPELKKDNVNQARENAEKIDADAVLLGTSRNGYERGVKREAEKLDVFFIDIESAIALADVLADHCALLYKIDTGAKSIGDLKLDAKAISPLFMEASGEIDSGSIRSVFEE